MPRSVFESVSARLSSRRLAIAAAAVVALVVGGLIVSDRQRSLTDVTVPPAESTSTTEPAPSTTTTVETSTTPPTTVSASLPEPVPVGFDRISTPDGVELPVNVASVWTGEELILWGGEPRFSGEDSAALDPGLAYDIESDSWRELSTGLLVPQYRAAMVWTGDEVLICCGGGSRQAASYEPRSDRWRPIADSPISSEFVEAVWTGSVMFLATSNDVASYDPSDDQWRVFDRAPRSLGRLRDIAWTGEELIVWPADLARRTAVPMALDPDTGSWRSLPEPPAWPAVPDIVWTGEVLVAWGGLPASDGTSERAVGSVYDPSTDSWTSMPEFLPEPRPFEGNLGSQSLLWNGETVIVGTGAFSTGLAVEPSEASNYFLSFDPENLEWNFIGRNPGVGGYSSDGLMAGDDIVLVGQDLYVSNDEFGTDVGSFVAPEYHRSLFSWTLRKPAGLADRAGSVAVWTGTEMLVWGGWSSEAATVVFDDGAAYNNVTDSWRPLADSPLSGRGFAAAAWTGEEMLVVGGLTDADSASAEAAAYDPSSDQWRRLPNMGLSPPALGSRPIHTVWNGTEFVVWDPEADELEAYSPATNDWIRLPSPGLGPADVASLHWVDGELVVLVSDFSSQQARYAAASLTIGSSNWEPLPDPPVAQFAGVAGDQVVTWGSGGRNGSTFALDLPTRTWSEVEPIPIPSCETQFQPMTIEDRVFVTMLCLNERRVDGGAALYHPDSGSWEVLDVGLEGVVDLDRAVWTGTEVLAFKVCCYGTGAQPFTWRGIRYRVPLD